QAGAADGGGGRRADRDQPRALDARRGVARVARALRAQGRTAAGQRRGLRSRGGLPVLRRARAAEARAVPRGAARVSAPSTWPERLRALRWTWLVLTLGAAA